MQEEGSTTMLLEIPHLLPQMILQYHFVAQNDNGQTEYIFDIISGMIYYLFTLLTANYTW